MFPEALLHSATAAILAASRQVRKSTRGQADSSATLNGDLWLVTRG
jgi:hypothetical protein